VRTNQGNAYKAVDGEFVATLAGTYYFIWTISNSGRKPAKDDVPYPAPLT
jgi:hypothetical protein